jgi:hypothetical protein
LAHQKHGFSWFFPQGQAQFISAHGLFQGFSDLVFRPEKPVRRHHAIDALMGPEVVVVGHEMPEPFLGLREILRLDPLPEFFPHRGPKSFRLAHGLGMVGTGHHVLDTFTDEKLLEVPFAPPGEVLTTLVGQHLLGFSEAFNTVQEGLGDDVLLLVKVQSPGNNVAAVIIQENRQIDPFMAAGQQKAGDIALPEFTRPRPFETSGWLYFPASFAGPLGIEAFFTQGVTHAPRADLDPVESEEKILHFPQAEIRKPRFDRGNLFPDPLFSRSAP